MEEKKKRFFLRWPWNVAVYVVLAVVLRIFSVPIILILIWIQAKNNPHGMEEGYCLTRTRKRLSWLLWAVLLFAIGVALGAVFLVGLGQDRTYWERMDYVTLLASGGAAAIMFLIGIYMGFIAVRDSFFPAKSSLAKSIREQMPYPDETPPVDELFAMVDRDLQEHGLWFDAVGIGNEWVLGDVASRVDRIRGIFTVDEVHRHNTQTGTRTSRTLQLVLIDDRWKKSITNFSKPKELRAAAEYLLLHVPGAAAGENGQYISFLNMDESEREEFEQKFRRENQAEGHSKGW